MIVAVSYLTVNALVLALLLGTGKDQSNLIWVVPVLTFVGAIYWIGRQEIKKGKAYQDILRRSCWFAFAVAYVMGVGGTVIMSAAKGEWLAGLTAGIATGWIGGLFACLPALVLVNQFFGDTSKPPNQAL